MAKRKRESYITKKKGSTECYPFRTHTDIKNMVEYFANKEQWNWWLAFHIGLLTGRRVSDTLSLKWGDIYYHNGRMKNEITTMIEMKTGKSANPYLCDAIKSAIREYVDRMNIKVTQSINDDIFMSARKEKYFKHIKEWGGYKHKTTKGIAEEDAKTIITEWVALVEKTGTNDGNVNKIYTEWIEDKNNVSLEDFLKEREYAIAIDSLASAFRDAFKKGASAVGIEYNVSTHSLRKSWGYWSRKLHPYDIDSIQILQKVFNHSSAEVTLAYIGLSREREVKYYNDMGEFFTNVMNGNSVVANNSPVISIHNRNLREILLKHGIDGDLFNSVMTDIENSMII